MAELELKDLKNKVLGKEKVDDSVFGLPLNKSLLNDFVIMQRRALRQGTHSTKTRAEVSGTGKKPFKQKGTGSARQGTLIGPHQPGGGIAFGPKPRTYSSDMNSKSKSKAVCVALSQKRYEGKLFVVENFEVASGKTKDAVKMLEAFKGKSYLVIGSTNKETVRSVRNLKNCKALSPLGLNVFDILKHDQVILTRTGLTQIVERFKRA